MKSCGSCLGTVLLLGAVGLGGMIWLGQAVKPEIDRSIRLQEAAKTPEQKAMEARLAKIRAFERAAKTAAQKKVLESIKTPMTAKIDLQSQYDPGKNVVVVSGHFDAQNAFGTYLRHKVLGVWNFDTEECIEFKIE